MRADREKEGWGLPYMTSAQVCIILSIVLKFTRESGADGEGKLARRRNKKKRIFHALSDSEIYTSEYTVHVQC